MRIKPSILIIMVLSLPGVVPSCSLGSGPSDSGAEGESLVPTLPPPGPPCVAPFCLAPQCVCAANRSPLCASLLGAVEEESWPCEAPYLPPPPRPCGVGLPPELVYSGPRTAKRIAITFDACSTRRPSLYDDRITKILLETGTPATLFLGGKWMQEHPEQTRALAALPQFELANHTYLHPHLTLETDGRIREELRWTQDIMFSLTGRLANLFRPPYGEFDGRVVRLAAEEGLTTVQFDLPSGDADRNAGKRRLFNWVTLKVQSGSIVVMHINKRGWHTAEALPAIIAELRARGFTLVTVGELLRDSDPEVGYPYGQ